MLCAGRVNAIDLPLLASILPSNEKQIRHAVDTILQLKRKKIGIVGLAFKPNTDDLRESPMVALVETLIGKGCDVRILDPNIVMARLRGANRHDRPRPLRRARGPDERRRVGLCDKLRRRHSGRRQGDD